MKEIIPDIYVETFFPGVNVGVIRTDDGVIAVDAPPRPADALAWRERILKATGGPIRWTILTDDHPDRLLGLGALGAPVIAGHGTLRRLQEGGDALWRTLTEEWARRWPGEEGLEQVRLTLPEVAVAGRLALHGSVPVTVESVPGAAPGSVWVRLAEQTVLFAGDTVVVDQHPSLASTPDSREWLRTLVDLRRARSPVRTIVPGRGPVCGKDDTRALSDYIQRARRRVRSVHTAGGGRGDLVGLTVELMALFPVPGNDREGIQRQVRVGLERVYEEFRLEREEE